MSPHLHVLVVDDHPVLRKGLVDMVNAEADMTVSGEAGSIASALDAVATREPDVAVVDLSLGHENGLDLVTALAERHPVVRILVLSGFDERLYADRAMKAGALGYIMKDRRPDELLAAIRQVGARRAYLSSDATERVLMALSSGPHREPATGIDRLSERERHVFRLVGRGLATREIAEQLGVSVKTVESHYAHIKEKLGLKSGREMIRLAVSWVGADPC